MLAYVFQVLNSKGYKNIATEEFSNVSELCAAILTNGIIVQAKRGLMKEYILKTESISSLKGKLDISESIKEQSFIKQQMVCQYDDFSTNSIMNKILKSTILLLLKSDISPTRKMGLRKLIGIFKGVDAIDLHRINWNMQYNKNNQTYRMLINICYFIFKGLIQTQTDGTTKIQNFIYEREMHRLYEKFILKYYQKEFPQIQTSAMQIKWSVDNGYVNMLPTMQSDITLSYNGKVLIIDAKYYNQALQQQFDNSKIRSGHLYQIFTYVKNMSAEMAKQADNVSGMLLYARTDEDVQPDNTYIMSGNKISVKTLDLNCDFSDISKQLNEIVKEHFGIYK
jgi:5-methylcytosine-specific restriction enzyme subunit McrC